MARFYQALTVGKAPLHALYVTIHLILAAALTGSSDCPHGTGGDTDTQKSKITCPQLETVHGTGIQTQAV